MNSMPQWTTSTIETYRHQRSHRAKRCLTHSGSTNQGIRDGDSQVSRRSSPTLSLQKGILRVLGNHYGQSIGLDFPEVSIIFGWIVDGALAWKLVFDDHTFARSACRASRAWTVWGTDMNDPFNSH